MREENAVGLVTTLREPEGEMTAGVLVEVGSRKVGSSSLRVRSRRKRPVERTDDGQRGREEGGQRKAHRGRGCNRWGRALP